MAEGSEEPTVPPRAETLMALPERARAIAMRRGLDADSRLYMAAQFMRGHGLEEDFSTYVHEATGG